MSTSTASACQTPAPYVTSADSDRVNTIGSYAKAHVARQR
jgi:hypothetical protein